MKVLKRREYVPFCCHKERFNSATRRHSTRFYSDITHLASGDSDDELANIQGNDPAVIQDEDDPVSESGIRRTIRGLCCYRITIRRSGG
jgi:hypothetical protein